MSKKESCEVRFPARHEFIKLLFIEMKKLRNLSLQEKWWNEQYAVFEKYLLVCAFGELYLNIK